jgi:hypothetical protein
VHQTKLVREVIASILETAWTAIAYHDPGVAEIAETPLKGDWLIVRKVRHLHA